MPSQPSLSAAAEGLRILWEWYRKEREREVESTAAAASLADRPHVHRPGDHERNRADHQRAMPTTQDQMKGEQ